MSVGIMVVLVCVLFLDVVCYLVEVLGVGFLGVGLDRGGGFRVFVCVVLVLGGVLGGFLGVFVVVLVLGVFFLFQFCGEVEIGLFVVGGGVGPVHVDHGVVGFFGGKLVFFLDWCVLVGLVWGLVVCGFDEVQVLGVGYGVEGEIVGWEGDGEGVGVFVYVFVFGEELFGWNLDEEGVVFFIYDQELVCIFFECFKVFNLVKRLVVCV